MTLVTLVSTLYSSTNETFKLLKDLSYFLHITLNAAWVAMIAILGTIRAFEI